MATLNDELADFARAIVLRTALSPQINLSYPNYSAEVAIEVYRNNYRGNLHDTLAGAYPVVEQLVGNDFFRLLTHKYIEQQLSANANLHHYGAEMASFIATFEPARELIYLSDVAALEWACHCAYFAEDADSIDLARLAQIPPEQYENLHLYLHPACQLIPSKYPIADIWHAHQPGADSEFHIDLHKGSCNALVSRKENVVCVSELPVAAAEWLLSIQAGIALGAATDAVLESHPDFDLQSLLIKLLHLGMLVDGDRGE